MEKKIRARIERYTGPLADAWWKGLFEALYRELENDLDLFEALGRALDTQDERWGPDPRRPRELGRSGSSRGRS